MKNFVLMAVLASAIGVAWAEPKFEMSNSRDVELQRQIDKKIKGDPRYRLSIDGKVTSTTAKTATTASVTTTTKMRR